MTYKRRVNVRGVIVSDGKLFSQQLTPDVDGEPRDYWCTPGGGVEDGESLVTALHREMIEETGVVPKIGKLLFISQFHDGEKEQLEFFFHITNPEDYRSVNLTATSHGAKEIDMCEFVDPSKVNVLPAFLQSMNLAQYIEGNHDVFITSELVETK